MSRFTTIKITKDFANALKKTRKYRRETYEDILKRSMKKMYPLNEDYKEVFKI